MIHYKKGYKYQLAENYGIQTYLRPNKLIRSRFLSLDKGGRLKIRAGYAWDGASGPTIDTKNSMRGSLVHDALYQLIRNRLLVDNPLIYGFSPYVRAEADDLFYKICREDGMSWLRAIVWWKALRKVGGKAANEESKKDLLSAGRK